MNTFRFCGISILIISSWLMVGCSVLFEFDNPADPLGVSPVAAKPVISPNGGGFYNRLQAAISTETEGAEIQYSFDGIAWHSGSIVDISDTTTIYARAVKHGFRNSPTANGAFIKLPSSSNAFLSALSVSSGTLVPGFSPTMLGYTVVRDLATSGLDISGVPEDAAASITVNGTPLPADASVRVPLGYGRTVISVLVTAQNETDTKEYILSAIRPVPVYRYYRSTTDTPGVLIDVEHQFSFSENGLGLVNIDPDHPFTKNGIVFYLYQEELPGLVPLHHIYDTASFHSLYTINHAEVAGRGESWNYAGIFGYVYDSEKPGTFEAKRYRSSAMNAHLLTINQIEQGYNGFQSDSDSFYESTAMKVFVYH